MIELDPYKFHTVSPLFDEIDHNVALVYSVIEGNSPGRIFVDHPHSPSSAFLFPEGTYYYVGGSENNEKFNRALVRLIFQDLLPHAIEKELILFAFSDAWREKLDSLLSDRGVTRIHRKIFTFNPTKFEIHAGWRERIPEGFCLRHIDEQFAEKHPVYKPIVDPGAKKFGVCLLKNDEIVSACTSVCVGRNKAEIDIHTAEKYRKQGFAILTACTFIETCLSKGLTPNWACWPERKASCALAKKLGFENKPDVPAHYWAESQ